MTAVEATGQDGTDAPATASSSVGVPAGGKRIARLAGLCYLVVVVLGGLAELVVRARVTVPGDAVATAAAYADNVGLVRFGILADLIQAVFFLATAVLLNRLLRGVDADLARLMVVLVAIASGLITLNMVFQQGALIVVTDSAYVSAFDEAGHEGLILLLTDLQYHGYLIAGIFFALWLVPLGLLVIRSGWFPRWIGVALILGCAGYLAETVTIFAAPDLGEQIAEIVVLPGAVGELSMMLYLLVVGVRITGGSRDTRGPAR